MNVCSLLDQSLDNVTVARVGCQENERALVAIQGIDLMGGNLANVECAVLCPRMVV